MPIDYGLIAMFVTAVVVLGVMVYLFVRSSERIDAGSGPREGRMVTVVKCGDGSEKTREYRDGDYVGLKADDCPDGVIVGIYKEAPQQR
ncbi:hypothetical protein TUZN_0667 [Thermoproteus uzoniensis 768-20]|uniref:Uncharacterized protein n=1 Tax=Thermoproteus uzoniensis (strain 768-20) TaxID=999630 RepID=F2L4I1_THEU7|nr:hypothetical protein [Thermoproteus uzoniensis]AEA12159.1 hypothetical protein TUZN_0667 [Thermoproteus uzoniensis 768-20]